MIERPTPLPGDISKCLATFCEAFVLAVRGLIRAEFFDDRREKLHPRFAAAAGLWVAHKMRLRIFVSKFAR